MSASASLARRARSSSETARSSSRVITTSNERSARRRSQPLGDVERQLLLDHAGRRQRPRAVAAVARVDRHPPHREREDHRVDGLRRAVHGCDGRRRGGGGRRRGRPRRPGVARRQEARRAEEARRQQGEDEETGGAAQPPAASQPARRGAAADEIHVLLHEVLEHPPFEAVRSRPPRAAQARRHGPRVEQVSHE